MAASGTQDKEKRRQKHNTICVGHHYSQTNTNNVNKTCVPLQITGGKDVPSIVLCGNRNVKTHNRTTQRTKKMSNTNPTKKPGVNSRAREG